MRDWEGCTTGTIGLPNPNQRSVVKTSGFLHYIYRYTARVPRDRFLAFEGEGMTWKAAIAAGNRTIFSAHGILAKHTRSRPLILSDCKRLTRFDSAPISHFLLPLCT